MKSNYGENSRIDCQPDAPRDPRNAHRQIQDRMAKLLSIGRRWLRASNSDLLLSALRNYIETMGGNHR